MADEKPYDPRPKLRMMIEALRMPAGADTRFSSMEAIAANRDQFIARVHGTWKNIHAAAVGEIVNIEILLARPEAAARPKDFISYLRYVCRIWRRVNDAIAWVIIAQPHRVRRLCANRVRPTLIESNPTAVAAVLDDINKDPASIAIWTDATTFVDVGDVMARRNEGELDFIELKAGKVNEAVFRLHDDLRRHRKTGDMDAATKVMDEFFDAYGKKGFNQVERVTKQLMRDMKVMALVNEEKGPDPDLDINIEIVESAEPSESYDDELTACLRRADADETATACIDGCLWIYVSHRRKLTRQQAVADFSIRVFAAKPETKTWLKERLEQDVLHPVGSLDQWSFVPTAVPLFLRPLEVNDVLDLLYGKLTGRVLLFFDWLRFADVVHAAECELTWVKPRPHEGHYVDLRVGKKTPRIGRPGGWGMRLGGWMMTEMLANGVRPSSVAAHYRESIRQFAARNPA